MYKILIFIIFIPELINCCIKSFPPQIKFQLYTGSDRYDIIDFIDGPQELINNIHFREKCLTVFYFPGWTENPTNHIKSVTTITDALLTLDCVNIVVINYLPLVKHSGIFGYLLAFINSASIGHCIGVYLKEIYPSEMPLDSVRLVSHSLGSQIMSWTAKTFGQGKLRLTGLDPSAPLYSFVQSFYLKKSDASFLDIFHTDSGAIGLGGTLGHVDYFVNDGTRMQPYCTVKTNYNTESIFCSHHMSWRYFADSIIHPKTYLAKRCILVNPLCFKFNPFFMLFGLCQCLWYSNEIAYMGWNVDTNLRGSFYSKTGAHVPFGLGFQGIV